MKYFHSDMYSYRGVPTKWVETNKNEIETIKDLYYNEFFVWDSDNCGDETIYFAFDSGKYYKLTHAWWFEYDEEDGSNIKYEYDIEEIKKEEAKNIASNRDWLNVY